MESIESSIQSGAASTGSRELAQTMPERLAIVIGSQCDKLNVLDALPVCAEDLRARLFDSSLGAWRPTGGTGLLLDPSVGELRVALDIAFRRASESKATLLFVFIGHGLSWANDFYLLPKDGDPFNVRSKGIHLNQEIKQLVLQYAALDGLVVVLDTCHSGDAVADAGHRLISDIGGRVRFDYLSSTDQREAYGCSFATLLAKVLDDGIVGGPAQLHCAHLREVVATSPLNAQIPFNLTFNADGSLFAAHNAIFKLPWSASRYSFRIFESLNDFIPVAALRAIVEQSQRDRLVAILGPPGTGKSTIISALAFPQRTASLVPRIFVQAVVLLDESSKIHEVAAEISDQLQRSLGRAWKIPPNRHDRNGHHSDEPLVRDVLQPLLALAPTHRVKIAIDALDQCPQTVREKIIHFIDVVCSNQSLSHISFVLASSDNFELPRHATQIQLGQPSTDDMMEFLRLRGVDYVRRESIVQSANGNWLIARLYADAGLISTFKSIDPLPTTLSDIYRSAIALAGEEREVALVWILRHLATPGAGPVMPIAILQSVLACAPLKIEPETVVTLLGRLRRLLIWSTSGSDRSVAPFHQTFVEFIRSPYKPHWRDDFRVENFLEVLKEVPIPVRDQSETQKFARAIEPELRMIRYRDVLSSLSEEYSDEEAKSLLEYLLVLADQTIESLERYDLDGLIPLQDWRDWSKIFQQSRYKPGVDEKADETLFRFELVTRLHEFFLEIQLKIRLHDHEDWMAFEGVLLEFEDLLAKFFPNDKAKQETLNGIINRIMQVTWEDKTRSALHEAFLELLDAIFDNRSRFRIRSWRIWMVASNNSSSVDVRLRKFGELTSEALRRFGPNDPETARIIEETRELLYLSGDNLTEVSGFLESLKLESGTLADEARIEVQRWVYRSMEKRSRDAMYF